MESVTIKNNEKEGMIKKLEEFNKFAEELFTLSFYEKLKDSGFEMHFKKDETVEIKYKGPDDEAIKAFVNDIRRFFQKNDTLRINKLQSIYMSGLVNESERNIFNQVMSDLEKFNKKTINIIKIKDYLFRWDDITENDNEELIEFFTQKFGIDWIKKANFDRIDNGRTIRLSYGNNFLSLKLNYGDNKVKLEIDDGRTDEFFSRQLNGKLCIYNKEDITNKMVWEVFLYGKISHRSEETKDLYDDWERSLGYVPLKDQFITILDYYLHLIDYIISSNNQILKKLRSND